MRKNLLASSICNPRVITREMELNFKRIWMEGRGSGIRGQGSGVRGQGSEDTVGDAITAASKLRMAMVKLEKGEYGQAVEISSSLLGEDGISPLAFYVLGVSRYRLGEDERAIEALKKSLSLNSRNPGAWRALGEIYLSKGEIDEANACLEKIAAFEERPAALRSSLRL
jgi:tetratricopeptide (TPR) repeat protein